MIKLENTVGRADKPAIERLTCEEMQVVVLMGGLGSRLKEQTVSCPKPLVPIHGKPFFEYELDLLLQAGFRKFVFLVGYRAGMIEEYFGDGSRYGEDVSIRYSYDGEVLLGTGGAVIKALPMLEEDFMLVYADSFMDVDYFQIMYRYFTGKISGQKALMTVMENGNRFDRSNVIYRDGEIKVYDKKNIAAEMSYIDYGIEIFSKEVFSALEEALKDKKVDLSDIQKDLVERKNCAACEETHRFYEIGTPASLAEFTGYVEKRFMKPHGVCFLDRDGVIDEIVFNEDTEQLDSPLSVSQFRFLPGAVEGLRKLSESGLELFVVSNQPAAAKGKATLSELYEINTYMVKELLKEGIEITEVSICPHHPTGSCRTKEQFLIRKCDCRKPSAGLLLRIMKKHNVDPAHSYMIGDSYTDILAGRAAGVKTAFIGDYKCDVCSRLNFDKPDVTGKNLEEAAEKIVNNLCGADAAAGRDRGGL